MNREEFANKWAAVEIYEDGLPISIVIQARYNDLLADLDSLSLPPAEGAEEISNAILAAAHDYDTKIRNHEEETADSDDYIAFINGAQWMREFAAQQQPTAEGAEEILERAFNNGEIRRITYIPDIRGIISAMNDFATFHAQRIAEKMVEERLREELIRYIKWYGGFNYENMTDEMLVNEYLKTRDSHESV